MRPYGSQSIGKTVFSSLICGRASIGVSGLCRHHVRLSGARAPEVDDGRRLMAGLLPIMWSHDTGSEVMRRMPCR